MIVGVDKFENCRKSQQTGNAGRSRYCSLEAEFLWETLVFDFMAFQLIGGSPALDVNDIYKMQLTFEQSRD